MADCSKTLEFSRELRRMCRSFEDEGGNCTDDCPFYGEKRCPDVFEITRDQIDDVQKWSYLHPPETYASRFFEAFPNADKNVDGDPDFCRSKVYGGFCGRSHQRERCHECWNEVMPK